MATFNLLNIFEEVQIQLETVRSLDRVGAGLLGLLLAAEDEGRAQVSIPGRKTRRLKIGASILLILC